MNPPGQAARAESDRRVRRPPAPEMPVAQACSRCLSALRMQRPATGRPRGAVGMPSRDSCRTPGGFREFTGRVPTRTAFRTRWSCCGGYLHVQSAWNCRPGTERCCLRSGGRYLRFGSAYGHDRSACGRPLAPNAGFPEGAPLCLFAECVPGAYRRSNGGCPSWYVPACRR